MKAGARLALISSVHRSAGGLGLTPVALGGYVVCMKHVQGKLPLLSLSDDGTFHVRNQKALRTNHLN